MVLIPQYKHYIPPLLLVSHILAAPQVDSLQDPSLLTQQLKAGSNMVLLHEIRAIKKGLPNFKIMRVKVKAHIEKSLKVLIFSNTQLCIYQFFLFYL